MGPDPAVAGAASLLERSITYMLGSVTLVRPEMLASPTPFGGWNLGTLLAHVSDSLDALSEAADEQIIRERAAGHQGTGGGWDPAEDVRAGARRALAAWSGTGIGGPVSVSGVPLSAAIVAAAGGIEIAAHGWDIARVAGWRRPVPASLADEMLDLLPLLIADGPGCRYAAAVAVPADACSGDRLIAFLGRRPPGPAERWFLQSRAALLLTSG